MTSNLKIGIVAVCTILLMGCIGKTEKEGETEMEMEEKKEMMGMEPTEGTKRLRHVVIFKFKDSTSANQVDQLNTQFSELQDHIPVIEDFEWGLNDSPEDFHQSFTHCYLLTFASEEDRDSIYTPHPKHQAFVASLQPHLEKVFVVDYWAH